MNPFKKVVGEVGALWGRLPTDTDESWQAFVEYRDMRIPRRLKSTTKVPVADVYKLYKDHGWRDRVGAYDAHLDELIREEREAVLKQEAREIAAEHMSLLASARSICATEWARIDTLTRESRGANVNLKTSELIKLTELTVKMDRLVRDQTTVNVAAGIDLSKLTDEELVIYEKLVDKAQAEKRAEEAEPTLQ